MIVPTLRVGMHPVTLRVTPKRTRSVQGGIPQLQPRELFKNATSATSGKALPAMTIHSQPPWW